MSKDYRIAIVGTGFSGLCLAIQLKQRGYTNFVLFEKADRVGGTWRENTYPGAECDIPSALYSYSFERNPNWTHKWSEQKEILAYLEHCARKYDIYDHIRFDTEVTSATFDEDSGTWNISTQENGTEQFDVFVSAVGQLHKPSTPAFPGADDFTGTSFHSAPWNHDVALDGKRVAVVGNAASAVQFIPEIAPKAEQLTIFQRSANWITPKFDREYSSIEKQLGQRVPLLAKAYRLWLFLLSEVVMFPVMSQRSSFRKWYVRRRSLKYIENAIDDPALRETVTPNYPIGAKRILFSDNFYEALNRNNVHIATKPIARIDARGVCSEDGEHYDADVIIYATGFQASDFLTPMRVTGRDGTVLNEVWSEQGAEAYLGITHAGFPNFFMMYGPNTNLGHNSVVLMFEAQTRYILSCLDSLTQRKARWLDVKKPVQHGYNEWLQSRLHDKSWNNVPKSWYMNAHGKITNNWVGRTTEYRRRTRAMNPDDYEFV